MRHSASPRYSILLSIVILLGSSATLVWGQSPTAAPVPPPAIKSVDITSAQKDYAVGQHVQFKAVARDESGNPLTEKPSAWFAAPFDLAAVDDNGTVTFFQPGEVMIGALVAGKPGFSKVIVKPAAVQTVSVDSVSAPLVVGGLLKLQATARVANGDPRTDVPISWASDTPTIATIDAAGVVTGIAPGKATLRATSGTASGVVEINVTENTVTSLSITPGSANARAGDVVHFKLTAAGAGNFVPRWTISGDGATIDPD